MKSTDPAELTRGETKPLKSINNNTGLRKPHGAVPAISGSRGIEAAADWHLPSGKSLEEFALEGGYLAPLLIGTSNAALLRPLKQQRKRV